VSQGSKRKYILKKKKSRRTLRQKTKELERKMQALSDSIKRANLRIMASKKEKCKPK
jgi:hypothetical protein